MEEKSSWWQQIMQHRVAIGFGIVLLVAIALIFAEVKVYGTGFAGKTLWDWLQLLAALAIPVVVGFGAAWFAMQQGKVSTAENTDNQRETALQAYIDRISELLLHEKLRDTEEYETQKIAQVRTLTVLSRLDSKRKRSVLQFLRGSGLIDKEKPIIDLRDADLSEAELRRAFLERTSLIGVDLRNANLKRAFLNDSNFMGANLRKANLNGAMLCNAEFGEANLSKADLSGATPSRASFFGIDETDLQEANLSGAILWKCDLSCVNLSGANLVGAYLKDVEITPEQLAQVKSLKGATMPDGSIHP